MKKLYLVYREVYATSIERAITSRGKIYHISEAKQEEQPEKKSKKIGLRKK